MWGEFRVVAAVYSFSVNNSERSEIIESVTADLPGPIRSLSEKKTGNAGVVEFWPDITANVLNIFFLCLTRNTLNFFKKAIMGE